MFRVWCKGREEPWVQPYDVWEMRSAFLLQMWGFGESAVVDVLNQWR